MGGLDTASPAVFFKYTLTIGWVCNVFRGKLISGITPFHADGKPERNGFACLGADLPWLHHVNGVDCSGSNILLGKDPQPRCHLIDERTMKGLYICCGLLCIDGFKERIFDTHVSTRQCLNYGMTTKRYIGF